ncbi:MAG: glutaredoxin [Candidatus Mycalebacterium zealandia]|nr:MAG: glutaredoxin [Candidatus Mycalebacterium zealandia]
MPAAFKIYTTKTCPYCIASKSLLDSKGIEYEEIDLTQDSELRVSVSEQYNWRTVPLILKNGELIGGFNELEELARQGGLDGS